MLKKTLVGALYQPWRTIASRRLSSSSSGTVDSYILRSLREHYLDISKMAPPPKVNPPSEFTILKGALDAVGPVLKRSYKGEEISISVDRMANLIPEGVGAMGEEQDDEINQLCLNVEVYKSGHKDRLQLLCGLYPDALGIYSVVLVPKQQTLDDLGDEVAYRGPDFGDVSQPIRDAFHNYVEERGINEELFPFLQAWLYVKDHRNLSRWFQTVGKVITQANLLRVYVDALDIKHEKRLELTIIN